MCNQQVIRVLSLPRREGFINRLQWKENSGGVDIYDETTTKEIARQARSPAINNAVQTAELASVNNSKKNTNTVEINVSSLTSRDQNPVSLLNSIVSLGYSLSSHLSLFYASIFLWLEFENRRVFFAVTRRNSMQLVTNEYSSLKLEPDSLRSFKRTYRHVKRLGSRRCAHCVRAVSLGGHVCLACAFRNRCTRPDCFILNGFASACFTLRRPRPSLKKLQREAGVHGLSSTISSRPPERRTNFLLRRMRTFVVSLSIYSLIFSLVLLSSFLSLLRFV